MKWLLCIGLFVSSSGFLIKVPTSPSAKNDVSESVDWIHRQKLLLPLFEDVCGDTKDPVVKQMAIAFNDLNSSSFYEPEMFTKLKSSITKGLLKKGEIFSEYNTNQMLELEMLYKTLYNAKTFDTFYKVACWARQNVNCGLYVDAIYATILKRQDTTKLYVPAPYSLLPNYFISKDIITKASKILAGMPIPLESGTDITYSGNEYILKANYTTKDIDNQISFETGMEYFHEDIGLSAYHFMRRLKMLTWFNDVNKENLDYGEYIYFFMKQLATRYDLERYSNGLGEVQPINWENPSVSAYDSELIYSNGFDFAVRQQTDKFVSEKLSLLQKIKNLVVNNADVKVLNDVTKKGILNNAIKLLIGGDESYESLAYQIVNNKLDVNNTCPTVLDHYITSLRDPVFWKVNKEIVNMIESALDILPPYAKNELYFPGVEVMNVEIKKVSTYCDQFDFDVTDALKSTDNPSFQVKISQERLNHKAFSLKLNVSSLIAQKGLVKIFLGPKVMPGEMAMKKNSFMLLDSFQTNMKMGGNLITRTSDQMKYMNEDFMSLKTLYKKVEDAEFGLDSLPVGDIKNILAFPSRLMLPKGAADGMLFQLFVFVAPYSKVSVNVAMANVAFNAAVLSPMYPLDLHVNDLKSLDVPNALLKEVTITYKCSLTSYGDGGKKWDGGEKFDYTSKKGQFGKNVDYASEKSAFSSSPVYNKPTSKSEVEVVTVKQDSVVPDDVDADNMSYIDGFVAPVENTVDHSADVLPLLKLSASKAKYPTVYDYVVDLINKADNKVEEADKVIDKHVYE